MKKRTLSFLLAATMVAASITGCGSASTSTGSASNASSNASASAAGAVASDDAIKNLIAATSGPVDLRVWASEEDQDLTTKLLDEFKTLYPEVTFNIELGKESESNAKDDILKDIEAAPDVFAFADDQVNELVKAGALMEVPAATYTYDVRSENVATSVEAASLNGQLYAYPMTADNGYFMFYDSSVLTADDVKSLDTMIEKAKAAGKKIAMPVNDAWYIYSFFKGAGLDLTLNDDGTNNCTWNAQGGTDVCQAIIDLCATGVFVNMSDQEQATALANGELCAAVNGTWRAESAKEAWGDNYSAAKLPTFTCGGKQVQMSSFSGYKLVGVSKHSTNPGWAMLLAEYLTSEAAQTARFEARGLGPANLKAASSEAVKAEPAISALAEQIQYATVQRVGGQYWSPAATLGDILAQGNPEGKDLQALLDDAVAGITAPVQ